MSIAPFSSRPAHTPTDPLAGSWRTRLAVAIVAVGIGATVLAYAISPGLRHAVSHAEHSVGHAVSRVFDRDHDTARKHTQQVKTRKPAPAHRASSTRSGSRSQAGSGSRSQAGSGSSSTGTSSTR